MGSYASAQHTTELLTNGMDVVVSLETGDIVSSSYISLMASDPTGNPDTPDFGQGQWSNGPTQYFALDIIPNANNGWDPNSLKIIRLDGHISQILGHEQDTDTYQTSYSLQVCTNQHKFFVCCL